MPGPVAALPDLSRVVAAFASLPHARFLGIRCEVARHGRITLSVDYSERLVGNCMTGVVHGGVITALLDTLSWFVATSVVPEGTTCATLDLRIDYLRPGRPGETIRATAECYKVTRSVAFTRGVAYHANPDNPIAHFAGSCMLGGPGFSSAGGDLASGEAG